MTVRCQHEDYGQSYKHVSPGRDGLDHTLAFTCRQPLHYYAFTSTMNQPCYVYGHQLGNGIGFVGQLLPAGLEQPSMDVTMDGISDLLIGESTTSSPLSASMLLLRSVELVVSDPFATPTAEADPLCALIHDDRNPWCHRRKYFNITLDREHSRITLRTLEDEETEFRVFIRETIGAIEPRQPSRDEDGKEAEITYHSDFIHAPQSAIDTTTTGVWLSDVGSAILCVLSFGVNSLLVVSPVFVFVYGIYRLVQYAGKADASCSRQEN